ncbi:MAG TPA: Rieske (2Fe-2S) protein [Nitrospiraceae bacterium]|nr:Rieske (2Fe-2S) protein [Nitrospiraceae bacterium]
MSRFITVAKIDDIPPGTCRTVDVQGVFVALCNVKGTVYALDNTCPHAGGPIGEGTMVDDVVTCPWHGWQFNVRTGERPENPDFKLIRCEVQIVGKEIQIAVPLPFK